MATLVWVILRSRRPVHIAPEAKASWGCSRRGVPEQGACGGVGMVLITVRNSQSHRGRGVKTMQDTEDRGKGEVGGRVGVPRQDRGSGHLGLIPGPGSEIVPISCAGGPHLCCPQRAHLHDHSLGPVVTWRCSLSEISNSGLEARPHIPRPPAVLVRTQSKSPDPLGFASLLPRHEFHRYQLELCALPLHSLLSQHLPSKPPASTHLITPVTLHGH